MTAERSAQPLNLRMNFDLIPRDGRSATALVLRAQQSAVQWS